MNQVQVVPSTAILRSGVRDGIAFRCRGPWRILHNRTDRFDRPETVEVAAAPTQGMAWHVARAFAKAKEAELVVHGRDGKIRRKDSFGKDPRGRG